MMKKMRVLVVDDEDTIRNLLKTRLEREGHDVGTCSNVDEAEKQFKTGSEVGVVVTDLKMPGKDGFQLMNWVRENYPISKIIVITGHGEKEAAVKALRSGAADYLEKPFEIDRLMEAIKRLLKNKSQNFSDISASGANYKIEKAKRFIEKNYDKRVRLSDVAAEICLSPKYLSRVFKEITGQGFNDYKLKIKTHKAEELLKSTPYTVDQISDKFGYKNLESFIRLFKKNTGITPAAYRKQRKKNAT